MNFLAQQFDDIAKEAGAVKIDELSSTTNYYGFALARNAPTSSALWRIFRVQKIGSVTTISDASGGLSNQIWDNRNDGIMFTPPSLTDNFSILLDGVNDYIDFGDEHNFDNAKAWSLSMWIKPDNLTAQRCLWSKASDDSNVFGWGFYHNNVGKLFLQMRASGAQLRDFTFNSILTTNWQNIILTYSGNQNINGVRIYINSIVENTPASGPVTNTLIVTEPSKLGRRSSSFHFSGFMNEVNFWNKALSQSEVDDVYNSGSPPLVNQLSFSSDLLHDYHMGDGDTIAAIIDNEGLVNGTLRNFPGIFDDIYKPEVP